MSPAPSKQARDLFAAARADGPDAHARDAVWERVASSIGAATLVAAAADAVRSSRPPPVAPAPASAGGGTAVVAGTSAVKLVAFGVAIGALATGAAIATAASVLEPVAPAAARRAPTLGVAHPAHGRGVVVLADALPRAKVGVREADDAPATPARASGAPELAAPAHGARAALPSRDAESALAEEARLLTEARRALLRGDAPAALEIVARVKRLSVRALQPEQMGIEARALRAEGRVDEAAAVELGLRARFPEHALAR